ncbi:hypothetical protein, partial [Salmonella enterica]|uniref:hypothetical protein n=1 Tax=Salmonella enterica TaxID=28901 RepID=UPI003296F518
GAARVPAVEGVRAVFAVGEDWVVAATLNGWLRGWRREEGEGGRVVYRLERRVRAHAGKLLAASYAPGAAQLVTLGRDGKLRVWDA